MAIAVSEITLTGYYGNCSNSLPNKLNTPDGCRGVRMSGVHELSGVGTSPAEPCRPTNGSARPPVVVPPLTRAAPQRAAGQPERYRAEQSPAPLAG
jgi:hypothetical protein